MTNYELHFSKKGEINTTVMEFQLESRAMATADRLLSYAGKLEFVKMFGGAVMRAENDVYNVHIVRS